MQEDPSHPPIDPDEIKKTSSGRDSGLETFHRFTDKVTGPSLRPLDNLISLAGALAGGVVGLITADTLGFSLTWCLVGLVAGAVAGLFLAGLYLLALGWMR